MILTKLLNDIGNARVLVIGDLMLDHYIWGDVHRISPEAPVPVVLVNKDTYIAGGAANVALNLTNLGARATVLGYYSQDDAGQRLLGILRSNGVEILPLQQLSGAPTIIKTRVIVRGQQMCRIDHEAPYELYGINEKNNLNDLLHSAFKKINAVIISDYAKGVITQSLLDAVLNVAAHYPDVLIAIDPKPSRRLSFHGAGLLTPNRSEAMELAGLPELRAYEEYPLEKVCAGIYEKFQPKLLVVTLGADGMAISKQGKIVAHLPTEAQQVFDVSGAGDTVIATLTAALSCGADPLNAVQLANMAAGCVVAHVGTAPILLDELQNNLEKKFAATATASVMKKV